MPHHINVIHVFYQMLILKSSCGNSKLLLLVC